jgi:hypothetical protein
MQKLGKRKMKATNMTQYKYNKTHTSLFCSWILFHELGIRNRTSYQLFPIPFIWCGMMSTHWSINNWTLLCVYFATNLCFFIPEFSCSCCLVPHLLSILWSRYVNLEMPTIEYQATLQISTSYTVINFCFFILSLLCNLFGTSKMKALLFSKERFQKSLWT